MKPRLLYVIALIPWISVKKTLVSYKIRIFVYRSDIGKYHVMLKPMAVYERIFNNLLYVTTSHTYYLSDDETATPIDLYNQRLENKGVLNYTDWLKISSDNSILTLYATSKSRMLHFLQSFPLLMTNTNLRNVFFKPRFIAARRNMVKDMTRIICQLEKERI